MSEKPRPGDALSPDEELSASEELFEALCELPPEARARYLDEHCANDPELRADVEELLSFDGRDPEFLRTPPSPPDPAGNPRLPEGGAFGPYRLLSLLGAGGFGEVYLAEQSKPVNRRVAVKLIKPGMDSRQVLSRFEAERQVLALMDHPGIAKVLDAGTTPSGRPYFAMEYVRGVPITEYCDGHQLGVRDRLALFDQVCRAIQHAHHKGIIHRDIKPSNVLVTERDGEPVPVVIDFGIAKALDHPLSDATRMTEIGQFLGTPEYISPEQADVSTLDIDTRSDVYSLGVLLYQLLTGTTPFDRRSLQSFALEEVRRVIREVDPPKPSTRLGTLGQDPQRVATARRAELQTLIRSFRGDLDWIVMKCLEKDRARRYDSPSALAEDLVRYRGNQPVNAGPPDFRYRAGKFVRRNRVAVVTGLLMLGVILTGTGLAIHGYVVARDERDLAEAQRKKAETIQAFFVDRMLAAANPQNGGTPETSVREVMARASTTVAETFADDPATRVAVLETLTRSYHEMGMYAEAEAHANLALEATAEAGLGDEARFRISTLKLDAIRSAGRLEDAERLARELALEIRRLAPKNHASLSRTESALGLILWRRGKFDDALAIAEPLLERAVANEGETSYSALTTRNLIALIRRGQGRNEEAIEMYRIVRTGAESTLGPDHPFTLLVMNNLGVALDQSGHDEEGEEIYRDTWMRRRRVLGETHPHTCGTLANLARSYHARGAFAEAEALAREAYGYQCASLGEDNTEAIKTYGELGESIWKQGRLDEAEVILRTCADKLRVALPDHADTLQCVRRLGGLLIERQKFAEAVDLFTEGLAMSLRAFPDGLHSLVDDQEKGLIEALKLAGRGEEIRAVRAAERARLERAASLPDAPHWVFNRLALFHLSVEFEDLQDLAAGLEAARKAVDLTEGRNPLDLMRLAEAYHGIGRLDGMVNTLEVLIPILPPDDDDLSSGALELIRSIPPGPESPAKLVGAAANLEAAIGIRRASVPRDD